MGANVDAALTFQSTVFSAGSRVLVHLTVDVEVILAAAGAP